jgi:predicted ATP-grasp superfamily ATP-dependent carboligase
MLLLVLQIGLALLALIVDEPGLAQGLLTGVLPASLMGPAPVLSGQRPVLLTMPAYGGTLAAARCLGRHGVPVTMAMERLLAPASWSRYVTRRTLCPSPMNVDRFMAWLLEFGRREPGHVLYPTCDDLAWLFAARSKELAESFLLYQPSAETILALLDKKVLQEYAGELGIRTLPTLFPRNFEEGVAMGEQLGYPLLLKPRSQVLLCDHGKGTYVGNADELRKEYRRFAQDNPYHPAFSAIRTGLDQPMLQTFHPDAAGGIYSLSGFIGPRDDELAVRAAVKVLQRPRRLGVGLCFESAEVEPAALDAVTRLCRKAGYFGVLEAEYLREDGHYHLLDFNPRFYGQMGFDVARGLPLPFLVWLGALRSQEELSEALAKSRSAEGTAGSVYCNRFFFKWMLSLQRLSGWMDADERERWLAWLEEPDARSLAFDSIDAPEDRVPTTVAIVRDVYLALRHPRSFYRQMIVGP